MFYCENCGELIERHQPVNSVVVERRQKVYQNEILRGKKIGEKFETKGWEIVKEKRVCPKCCIVLTGRDPQRKTDPRINVSKKVVYVNEQPENDMRNRKRFPGNRDNRVQSKRPEVQVTRRIQFKKD